MARGSFTLYDLPEETRAIGAAKARAQIHEYLRNPLITPAQRAHLLQKLAWSGQWERCDVAHILPVPEPLAPVEVVQVQEEVLEPELVPESKVKGKKPVAGLKFRESTITIPPPTLASGRVPQNHDVALTESLEVSEEPTKD